ncbi:MAG TPA: PQQ-binding-like beta-propeller repeat protein [Streptosporangiaceae bacterium]|nr:PQQ-binding-like beta-propeller repeat protein [Streptosporangiaceae bacterium]
MRRWWPSVAAGIAVLAVACTSAGPAQPPLGGGKAGPSADWPTFNRTAARDGVSVSSPPPGKLRKSWSAVVDGVVYAQPLIVGSDVIVATENDSVYALNSATGKVRWSRRLATPVTGGLPCGNVAPSGITGTPVADVAAGRLWVVTFTSRPSFRHTLWELATATGKTIGKRPIDAPGSDPRSQQERGALALAGSRVYVPFGGLFGDCSDYKGRVVGAPVSGSGRLVTFTTRNERQAGIWAPAGESVRAGSLYVATGNGLPFNRVADSDSVLRLSPELRVLGSFTPAEFETLSTLDQDLGSTAPALLPGGLVFQVGKQGTGYVLNGQMLGGVGGQLASAKVCEGGFGGDAVLGGTVVFSCYTSLRAVQVSSGNRGGHVTIRQRWAVRGISPGPPIIAGGTVWDLSRHGTLTGYRFTDGKVVTSVAVGHVATDFPSAAASGSRIIVPASDKIVSYVGI